MEEYLPKEEVRTIKYWFTADCHFGHHNIIRYTGRPFKDVNDMNNKIIHNWNARVKDEDQVYHVGDFAFRNSPGGKKGEGMTHKPNYWASKLNGDIIYIIGNHDKNNGVKTLIHKVIIKYGGRYICLIHDPDNYDVNFGIHFVGHIHEKWMFKRIYNPLIDEGYIDFINVGVDVWNFHPVTFEEIYSLYKKWSRGIYLKWKNRPLYVNEIKTK